MSIKERRTYDIEKEEQLPLTEEQARTSCVSNSMEVWRVRSVHYEAKWRAVASGQIAHLDAAVKVHPRSRNFHSWLVERSPSRALFLKSSAPKVKHKLGGLRDARSIGRFFITRPRVAWNQSLS